MFAVHRQNKVLYNHPHSLLSPFQALMSIHVDFVALGTMENWAMIVSAIILVKLHNGNTITFQLSYF